MLNPRIDYLIEYYGLSPLQGEGGFFRFNDEFGAASGSILYLITKDTYSSLHLLSDDEIWFFLEGDPAVQIVGNGELGFEKRILSSENRYSLVKGGCYQATRLQEDGEYALFSTVMSPRYRNDMFSLPTEELLSSYPELKEFCHGEG